MASCINGAPRSLAGDFAHALHQLSKEDQIEARLNQVEEIYPGSRQHLVAAQTAEWQNNPYMFGGYSNFSAGQVTQFWEALRSSNGRFFFAGEHISTFIGYMEGAVLSGQRVAKEIVQLKKL